MSEVLVSALLAKIERIERRVSSASNLVETFMTAVLSPDEVLRLCRAHRDIIEQYREAARLAAERNRKRVHGVLVMEAEAAEQALLDVVAVLARGLGVEESVE